jgi:hypothetical protein
VNASHHVPEFMRAVLGDETFRDVESIATRLVTLEERGAISSEWHNRIIEEIAEELVSQKIANDVASETSE